MSETKEFKHQSVQDRVSILKYLETISDGIKMGELNLESADEKLQLKPSGLLQMKVKAKKKSERVKFSISIEWNEKNGKSEGKKLKINANSGDDE
ncbi:MAG: amphi-Trp domain-containing protein [Candidatus Zixiibacteriota bacterium]